MKIVVTSGGTGGHVYPAISLIKYLENYGEDVLFIGCKNKLEEEVAKKEEINFIGLNFNNRNGLINKIKFIFSIIKNIFKTIKIFNEYKPDAVVGFGNYISFPVCIASRIKKIPIILHEQNSTMGKANIFLGLFAKKIGYSIPLIKEYHKNKLVRVGNPRSNECIKNRNNVNIDMTKNNILIMMGSLGSSSVNKVLIKFINSIDDSNIYHIVTGKKHYESFKDKITNKSNINIYPYLEDSIAYMKKCDVLVSRSGATTISEITTLGIPTILIPSPYVINNHQFHNASYLLKNEACLLLEEKNLNCMTLKNNIDKLLNNNALRIKLRLNSMKLATFNSSSKIYDLIKEVTDV